MTDDVSAGRNPRPTKRSVSVASATLGAEEIKTRESSVPSMAERFSVHEWYGVWLILDSENGQAIKVLTWNLAYVYCKILNQGHRKLRKN